MRSILYWEGVIHTFFWRMDDNMAWYDIAKNKGLFKGYSIHSQKKQLTPLKIII